MPSQEKILQYNLQAVPRNLDTLKGSIESGRAAKSRDAPIAHPESALVDAIMAQAEHELPRETLNHSLRVFQWGAAIAGDFFPSWKLNHETFLLACLLHDLGTTPEKRELSFLSFEFHGGLLSHAKIVQAGGESEQADSVAESIIRHQDIDGEAKGSLSQLGALLQLGTLYDNAGLHDELIHVDFFECVTDAIPRMKWSDCFEAAIFEECKAKPWCHTTKIGAGDFSRLIRGNTRGNSKD